MISQGLHHDTCYIGRHHQPYYEHHSPSYQTKSHSAKGHIMLAPPSLGPEPRLIASTAASGPCFFKQIDGAPIRKRPKEGTSKISMGTKFSSYFITNFRTNIGCAQLNARDAQPPPPQEEMSSHTPASQLLAELLLILACGGAS